MFEQYIYGLCLPETNIPVYVGRSKDAKERKRLHETSFGDYTPKGLWIKYLKKAALSPHIIILESDFSESELNVEQWAKSQEQMWIRNLLAQDIYLFNHGYWWNHPDRKLIPKGVRKAWTQLHAIYFRIDPLLAAGGNSYHEVTQFMALNGIRGLTKQYPGLAVAPLEWLGGPT